MVVLAATMLLSGGLTLVSGLLLVRDPRAAVRHTIHNVPRTPAVEEAVRKLEPILDGIVERHRTGLRIDAIAMVGFGLFTLYAVAAVLSRDRNRLRLAVLTAVFGIVYQLAELPLSVSIAKETVALAGPLLADIIIAAGDAAGRSQAELVAALNTTAARSPLFAVIGLGWCLLLLIYFGGRRGRELYGLRR